MPSFITHHEIPTKVKTLLTSLPACLFYMFDYMDTVYTVQLVTQLSVVVVVVLVRNTMVSSELGAIAWGIDGNQGIPASAPLAPQIQKSEHTKFMSKIYNRTRDPNLKALTFKSCTITTRPLHHRPYLVHLSFSGFHAVHPPHELS